MTEVKGGERRIQEVWHVKKKKMKALERIKTGDKCEE